MVKKDAGSRKIQELENQLKRALADYSNLQRRVEQEKEQIETFAKAAVVTKTLHVLDILEAIGKAGKNTDLENLKKGIEIAIKEFQNTLASIGVEEIDAKGDFDPGKHEAIEVVQGAAENKIVEVVEKGYKIGEKILRSAKVKVSKKKTGQE